MKYTAINQEVSMDELYSLENAQKFNWSSVSGNLNPERVSHLETYIVGKKILDAGCGGGAYVEFLSRKGIDATGVDKYKQFLQLAREQGRMGTYVEADITNLPFSDNTFDCTYCFDVLEHVDDQLALKEIARVTTKRLIIAVPKEDEVMNEFNLTFLHYQDKTHLRNYTETYLKKLLTMIDFSEFIIFPELVIPAKNLVQKMIDFEEKESKNSPFNPRIFKIIIKNLMMKKLSFRSLMPPSLYQFLIKQLLDEVSYKTIHTGLVAVIDLEPSK